MPPWSAERVGIHEGEPTARVLGVDEEPVPAAEGRAEDLTLVGPDDACLHLSTVTVGRTDGHGRNLDAVLMTNRARLLERLARASAAGSDLVTLWRDVAPILREAVPHFEAPCFFTVDPSSLLTTSHFQEGLPEIPAEWLGREYAEGGRSSGSLGSCRSVMVRPPCGATCTPRRSSSAGRYEGTGAHPPPLAGAWQRTTDRRKHGRGRDRGRAWRGEEAGWPRGAAPRR